MKEFNQSEGFVTDNLSGVLRVIRMIILLLTIGTTGALSSSYSQNTLLSLDLKKSHIKSVFTVIEKNSEYVFLFNDEIAEEIKKDVSIQVKNASLSQVLNQLFQSTDLEYRIVDRQVLVTKKRRNELRSVTLQEKNQPVVVSGTIVDESGEPLAGATIVLKSAPASGAIANVDGEFSLQVPGLKESLIVSFIGMKTKEVALKEGVNKYRIVLEPSSTELTEVVATGVFNKAKESYTGAATIITAKELAEVGNRSVLTSIRNIDPSFNILQDISAGSDPNRLPSITIRGSSSLPTDIKDLQSDTKTLQSANLPLFIMDGFEIPLSRLNDLDENQIESYTLLKDANATAMYGSRGANGIVVITTKKPEEGRLRVTYKGTLNIEAPDLSSYNLMNAREKLRYEKAAGLFQSINANQEQELLDLYNERMLAAERGVDTYWLKYPVRTGIGHRHSLRLEGGSESFRYAGSVAYNNVAGTMKESVRNTFNGNVFLAYKYKSLTFQNDLQVASNTSRNSPYGSFADYTKLNSYWKPYDDEGNLVKELEDFYYVNLNRTNQVYNPLYNAFLPQRDETKYQQVINNFSIEWTILPELFFRGRFSVMTQNDRWDYYKSAKDTRFDNYEGDDYARKGSYTYKTGYESSYDTDLTLNYSKTFNKVHQLFAGLGYNLAESKSEKYTIIAEGISNVNMDFLGMANQYQKEGSPAGQEGISRRVGAFFTANYTYDRRYFVDFSGRTEGSSQFGANKRYAPFGSVGVGWNLHHEAAFSENRFLDIARLRLSYGTSGSQNFSSYQSLTTFKDYGGKNYRGWSGVSLLALGNPDLSWQTTRQVNIGTELEFLKNRVRLHVDVYNKVTDDLLADINLPTSSGFDTYKANLGKVSNRGLEVSMNAYLIRNRARNLSWSVGMSLAHNKNEIQQISNSLKSLNERLSKESGSNPSFMFQEGESVNTIYAVPSKGIDPSNGLEIFVKQDGTETYTWDPKDKVAVGVSEPNIWGNLNTMLRFRGITFNAVFGYRYGGQMFNSTLISKVENIYPYNNADERALYGRWKQPGDQAFFKSVTDFSKTNASSRFVMDENTLECRTLSLGYDVPFSWLQKHTPLQYLSLTGYLEDPFQLSSIRIERGVDYPYARKISFSLTARF